MRTLYLILLIVAAVLFALAAFLSWVPSTTVSTPEQPARPTVVSRVNLMALGLLFWVLVPLIQTADRLND